MNQSAQFLLALAILFIIIQNGAKLLTWLLRYDQPKQPELYPIKYPIEPMNENYFDVVEEIKACKNEQDLNAAYVRIIIFQGCYQDSGSFVHELFMHYEEKQNELKIIS